MLNANNTDYADAGKQSVRVAAGCPQEGIAITLTDDEVTRFIGAIGERPQDQRYERCCKFYRECS